MGLCLSDCPERRATVSAKEAPADGCPERRAFDAAKMDSDWQLGWPIGTPGVHKAPVSGRYAPSQQHVEVANRIRVIEQAQRRARRQRDELGSELREARLTNGLRQCDVARALGWSHTRVGRIERAESRRAPLEDLAEFAGCVGLALSTRLYPSAGRLRDAAQLSMINRFRELVVSGGWHVTLEAPVGGAGDQRAFDLLLTRGGVAVALEFISRLRDVQAQVRRLTLKQAAAHEARLILVIAGTHANRRAVVEAGGALRDGFPLTSRAILEALRQGRDPGGNGIVFV